MPSLRHMYGNLKRCTLSKFKLDHGEVTVGHVAKYCRQVHGEGKCMVGAKKEERQQQVIDFFQRKVEEQGIAGFI